MTKSMTEVLEASKGPGKAAELQTGKAVFSKSGWEKTVAAAANDTTFKIPQYDKDGKKVGEVNLSELLRGDLQKTIEKAQYPQPTEKEVLKTCEVATSGLSQAIPLLVMEYLKTGHQFPLPTQPNVDGSVYLADVKGKTKEVNARDPKTQTNLGTVTITTQDSVQLRTKSPVPDHLQVKVRKDPSGKVIASAKA